MGLGGGREGGVHGHKLKKITSLLLVFIIKTFFREMRSSNCYEWVKELKGFRGNLFGIYFFNWHAKTCEQV
jgi:hypothetical protein